MTAQIRHAGLVAARDRSGWRGILIEGPSGAGKSDLALRLLAAGFRLVADDRTVVFASGDRPHGRAPDPVYGLVEVRGLGVVVEPALPCAEINLVVCCVRSAADVERWPERRVVSLPGGEVPALDLWPFEDSAPAKLRRAIEQLGRSGPTAYQTRVAQGRTCAET